MNTVVYFFRAEEGQGLPSIYRILLFLSTLYELPVHL
jgi:hypothetical protein